jgi:hypothetical protein
MRTHITRALYAAVAAAITLGTPGFAGAGSPATAAPGSISPPEYSPSWAGYSVGGGRWFRFISTTLTVPAITGGSGMDIGLSHGQPVGQPFAELEVEQGGGTGSVSAHVSPGGYGTLPLSPRVGDQLAISIYYDQHGHDYFTASDTTQHITRTVRLTVGSVVYNHGFVVGLGGWPGYPPQADTRLLQFTGSHVTTYTGAHGTLTGPWATWKYLATTGTAAGTVIASPSGLSNSGANFGVWLRAVPLTYTSGFAGYADSVGPFRFVATTMTVPPAQTPPANGGTALVTLLHNGGPTPRPYANIQVTPGGGAGSISYASNNAQGTFTVNPAPGDQVTVSIFYDQNSHYTFTATDTTQGTTQTVTVAAPYAASMPLNSAQVQAMFDNSTVVPPPADTQIWQFTGSKVTTYRGDHGSILGPWATSRWIDTTDGTHAGAVVADASVLPIAEMPNGGHDFGVWLRHH